MSRRRNVLVTRPIMQEPTRLLRERCDVTIHQNEFGIPREELLQVVRGRDAIVTMLTEKVDAELLAAAGPQPKIVANHAHPQRWGVAPRHYTFRGKSLRASPCKKGASAVALVH